MLFYPIVIDPDLLIKLDGNQKLTDKFKKFVYTHSLFAQDCFILVDDGYGSLKKKYDAICKKYESKNLSIKYLIEEFVLKFYSMGKKINIDTKVKNSSLNDVIKELKNQKVKNILNLTEEFDTPTFNGREVLERHSLKKLNVEKVKDMISSITRFSKNVHIIDPMIPFNMTNLNNFSRSTKNYKKDIAQEKKYMPYPTLEQIQNEKNANRNPYIKDFKDWIKKLQEKLNNNNELKHVIATKSLKNNPYFVSLQEIVNLIYSSNLFKNNLKITISTTINPSKPQIYEIKNDILELERQITTEKHNIGILREKISAEKQKLKIDKYEIEIKLIESKIKDYSKLYKDNLETWNNLKKLVQNCIQNCLNNVMAKQRTNIEIKRHKKTEKDKIGTDTQDQYDRGIVTLDLGACLNVRKGFDLFEKPWELTKKPSYYLNLIIGDDQKLELSSVLTHLPFKQEVLLTNSTLTSV